MKNTFPVCSDTILNDENYEWIPKSFTSFLAELNNIISACHTAGSLVLFRGHSRREWLLESTFARSCKNVLFGVKPEVRLSKKIRESIEYHRVLLNMFLLKYGVLARPSEELETLAEHEGVDAWFELMKKFQQYPDEDRSYVKGSNLLDWTQSLEVALYFANQKRDGEGALWICDATATGKTLQVIPVGAILDKMAEHGNAGKPLGSPLLFYPPRQIHNQRANNQQAVYFAQMDLRYDLEVIWREREKELGAERTLAKLILPVETQQSVDIYLAERGIARSFLYPNE